MKTINIMTAIKKREQKKKLSIHDLCHILAMKIRTEQYNYFICHVNIYIVLGLKGSYQQ